MSEITEINPQEKQKAFQDLSKADYWANSGYPQMYGPKTLALGASFLRSFIDKKITYNDFISFSPDTQTVEDYSGRVDRLHRHYGRKIPVDRERVGETFDTTQSKVGHALVALFGVADLDDFFEDTSNMPKIEAALSVFESGVEALDRPEMIDFCERYRQSFSIIFEKPISEMTSKERADLKQYWDETSTKIENLLVDSIGYKNRHLTKSFDAFRLQSFLKRVAIDGSKVVGRDRL